MSARTNLKIYENIKTGKARNDPSILSTFYTLTFADLKKYKFFYWFAFPTAVLNWTLKDPIKSFTVDSDLTKEIESWRNTVPSNQWGFFFITKSDSKWSVSQLQDFKETKCAETFAVFCDPSSHANVPGWPLRNFLMYLSHHNLLHIPILAYRTNPVPSFTFSVDPVVLTDFKSTGWERVNNKLIPKQANLGSLIDPVKLADQAVDLNLKLMKWRIAPDLDLDIVKNTSCLLLGAGTLGSYIARGLMGWGVRRITFVDSGTVSYSNPVRQPLYTFKDCLNGGAVKAEQAAAALKEIYPSIDSQGFALEIPMAGHAIRDEEEQRKDYEKLLELIESHDVIFLLVDSRESRWLPTVIGSAKDKVVINAALGFDSYVVMRHGLAPTSSDPSGEAALQPHLGCYFCNDVVAPIDSLSNRTLDQMCTVTRPGVSLLASAYAVELLVSVLQHPLKGLAPVSTDTSGSSHDGPLNTGSGVPHQIRGFLGTYETMKISGQSYNCCSACSHPVRSAWLENGWEFVKQALNEPQYVEELSGLAEVKRKTEELEMDLDWSGEDSDGL